MIGPLPSNIFWNV